jgi:hypothetical protein
MPHLPPNAQRIVDEFKLNRTQVDQLVADFFRIYDDAWNRHVATPLTEYFELWAIAERQKRSTVVYSLKLEKTPDAYRAIVFNIDWQDCHSVADIAEADSLAVLRKFLLSPKYGNVITHVQADGLAVAVDSPSNAWAAAVALLRTPKP